MFLKILSRQLVYVPINLGNFDLNPVIPGGVLHNWGLSRIYILFQSEYISPRYARRAWMTGFNGSAGIIDKQKWVFLFGCGGFYILGGMVSFFIEILPSSMNAPNAWTSLRACIAKGSNYYNLIM